MTDKSINGSISPMLGYRLSGTESQPVYGWNPLRRLFRRPLYWVVTYNFTNATDVVSVSEVGYANMHNRGESNATA